MKKNKTFEFCSYKYLLRKKNKTFEFVKLMKNSYICFHQPKCFPERKEQKKKYPNGKVHAWRNVRTFQDSEEKNCPKRVEKKYENKTMKSESEKMPPPLAVNLFTYQKHQTMKTLNFDQLSRKGRKMLISTLKSCTSILE